MRDLLLMRGERAQERLEVEIAEEKARTLARIASTLDRRRRDLDRARRETGGSGAAGDAGVGRVRRLRREVDLWSWYLAVQREALRLSPMAEETPRRPWGESEER